MSELEIKTTEEETSLADDIEKLKEEDSEESGEEQGGDESESLNEEETEEETEEEKAERERLEKAREDYKRRQEEKRRKAQEVKQDQYTEQAKSAVSDADKEALEFVKQIREKSKQAQLYEGDKREFAKLESDFITAYPDYEDKKRMAQEFLIDRYVGKGMTEDQAKANIEYETILHANQAVMSGQDPVEAVYKEAQAIISAFEKFAEKNGYVKPGKKKTQLQALREATKPNAMSGGAGKGATAAKKTMEDMDTEEMDGISLGDMLSGKY